MRVFRVEFRDLRDIKVIAVIEDAWLTIKDINVYLGIILCSIKAC